MHLLYCTDSEAELDQLFGNIDTYPRAAIHAAELDAIIKQAIEAVREWQTCAVKNYRPIYTGISDQMLSYSRLFLANVDPAGCAEANHPNLEQLRITLLAALIGFNQHRTYDECMVASHGLTYGGITLRYEDRVGYREFAISSTRMTRSSVTRSESRLSRP
jgi:hypothetical protein